MFLSITVYITAVWPYLPASLEDAIILLSVANVHLFVRSDVARSVSRTVRSAPLVIQKLTKFRRVQLTPDYLPPSLPPRGPGFILSGFRQLRKALPVPSPSRTSLSVVRLRGMVLTVTPNKPADATRRPRPSASTIEHQRPTSTFTLCPMPVPYWAPIVTGFFSCF